MFRLVEAGMTATAACLAAGVSRRFYYRCLPAWGAAGEAGLLDRSSRPHSSARRLPGAQEHIAGLRAARFLVRAVHGSDRRACASGGC